MKDNDYYEDDDWDEEDWERFLQKADVRTAKYLELFETLHNHPDCDTLIAKEMGWIHKYEGCVYNDNESCDSCEKRGECRIYEINQIFDNSTEYEETIEGEVEDVKNIVAYKKSYEFYIKLSKYFKNREGVGTDEDILDAISASSIIPAKIAGGHGMGYERDMLCGNIANCKRSLKNAKICVYMLEIVRAKSTFPERDINILISEAIKVEREVFKWIEYLRSRIWWR
ncbi:MAG: hypothetical protein HOI47_33040 [Candidatus Scalindua sp.]|jgi:hypothetical protein|nr:hypothetical protein [Candidatus Scalindua sp.]MBT5304607.1 hypothetical protein [Candidatus Scalindua sp.]MBT6051074.1 hypothetical protein [Candidatus Scalindua sp.]MBT6231494.1 hypothetical protein [Candidatus Scalindua sp.]MBT7212617.1 hypothetical protein [Candidatus Scalindua sp.]